MTYEQFIRRFDKRKDSARGCMVKCPAHEDKQASLAVSRYKDGGVMLKCFAGCKSEDIVAKMGLTMRDLFAKELPPRMQIVEKAETIFGNVRSKPIDRAEPDPKAEVVAQYSYTDAFGRELYQALRLKPKSFRQRHMEDGKWVWKMDGVERVLYRLPEVLKSREVWVVEGEKDADNLVAIGFCATTNVGGAGKWLDGYTDALAGKDVVICGDNDEPGQKHARLVFDSVSAKARTVRMVKVPGVKDVSDLIESSGGGAAVALKSLAEMAVPHVGGVRMPVYSMADMQANYKKQVRMPEGLRVDLGLWLPSFRGVVRPLLPGEVVMFVGDTGIGKTMILQNLIMAFPDMPRIMFELELPQEMMFERFWCIKNKCLGTEVEEEYRNNDGFSDLIMMQEFKNLFVCPESHMSIDQFETVVVKAELKMGVKPTLVCLDYAQLMRGKGNSRYERMSEVAEGIKVVAKATQTVIVVASQVDRASGREGNIGLHSAKDSGSLENSAGVVIACSRDEEDKMLLRLKVVKSTKGGAGLEVDCTIDGARSLITERSKLFGVKNPNPSPDNRAGYDT